MELLLSFSFQKWLTRNEFKSGLSILDKLYFKQYIISASISSIKSDANTARIRIESFASPSNRFHFWFFWQFPFPIFPLPFVRSPIKKPTPDHVRITISFVRPNERERPLDDRITRVYLCIQSTFHFVGPPIFFLFTLFSSPLSHSLTISRTRDRSLGGRRNVGCYSRKILWVRYRRLR